MQKRKDKKKRGKRKRKMRGKGGEEKKRKEKKKEGGVWEHGVRGAWALRRIGPHTKNARST